MTPSSAGRNTNRTRATTVRPAPDPTPFSQAQLDDAKKVAAAAVKAAADRAAAAYGA